MVAGLTIYNTSSTVQVDENWRNYGLKQIIPATITAYYTSPPNPPGYSGMTYSISVSGTNALLIGCRSSTLVPVKLHQYYDGSVWTFSWVFMVPEASEVTETVYFYVFDTMDGSYSNVGLEVFNASGQRVFHSDAPVMKLGGVQLCSSGFSGVSGRIYVPVILQNPLCGEFVFGVGYRCAFHCLRSSGSNISTTFVVPGAFGASGAYTNLGLYAAIDVTGLG